MARQHRAPPLTQAVPANGLHTDSHHPHVQALTGHLQAIHHQTQAVELPCLRRLRLREQRLAHLAHATSLLHSTEPTRPAPARAGFGSCPRCCGTPPADRRVALIESPDCGRWCENTDRPGGATWALRSSQLGRCSDLPHVHPRGTFPP
eukprot:scaffold7583_cov64-Phaeocystis_antarctica.AAC.3